MYFLIQDQFFYILTVIFWKYCQWFESNCPRMCIWIMHWTIIVEQKERQYSQLCVRGFEICVYSPSVNQIKFKWRQFFHSSSVPCYSSPICIPKPPIEVFIRYTKYFFIELFIDWIEKYDSMFDIWKGNMNKQLYCIVFPTGQYGGNLTFIS